jgi:hypothetical protein
VATKMERDLEVREERLGFRECSRPVPPTGFTFRWGVSGRSFQRDYSIEARKA